MPIDPHIAALLQLMKPEGAPELHTLPVAPVRDALIAQATAPDMPKRPLAAVENRHIAGPADELPVRIYHPEGTGPFPLLVFLHGGGWVICNLDTHDDICRDLCADVGAVVVSVDYRLAPEHKFPAGLDDVLVATQWAAAHAAELGADATRIALVGDSAGGNLAIACALRCGMAGAPALRALAPLYPVSDLRLPSCHASVEVMGRGDYGLSAKDMQWFISHYLSDATDALNPFVSPLLSDALAVLPPTLLVTAQYDPLCDEGKALAERIAAAGVPVNHHCYEGLPHAFMNMTALAPAARRASQAISAALAAMLAR